PLSLRLSFYKLGYSGIFKTEILTKQFMKDLRYSNQNTKESIFFSDTISVLLNHKKRFYTNRLGNQKNFITSRLCLFRERNLKIVIEHILNLAYIYEPTLKSVFNFHKILDLLLQPQALLVTELALRGEDILEVCPNLPPKEIGSVLGKLLSFVLENPEANRKDSLIPLLPK
ncbi:hypothetical protein LEP1GSC124_0353, partial [Leptospira interrogans serovar Pyrogenes str. 200701872]